MPGRARPAHRLRRRVPRRARPVRLHAVLAARQRRLVAPQRPPRAGHVDRGRRPPARAPDARRRRPRRVPRRARGDRHLRPLAGGRSRSGSASTWRSRSFDVATPSAARSVGAEVALSPAQRSAMIYALDLDQRDELVERVDRGRSRVRGRRPGHVALERHARRPSFAAAAASCASPPGGDLIDLRGERWSVEGELAALRAEIAGRALPVHRVPGRARRGSGRRCTARPRATSCCRRRPATSSSTGAAPTTSAAGSHGSLHRSDSLGALLWCGTGPDSRDAREQWSLRDVAPMVREHFGLGSVDAAD